ncbi:hypothetical protein A2U01_0091493, partial [Trifolium medium]|nr:hypothetical protein [Trifolium medium]
MHDIGGLGLYWLARAAPMAAALRARFAWRPCSGSASCAPRQALLRHAQ